MIINLENGFKIDFKNEELCSMYPKSVIETALFLEQFDTVLIRSENEKHTLMVVNPHEFKDIIFTFIGEKFYRFMFSDKICEGIEDYTTLENAKTLTFNYIKQIRKG